jgi:cobalt-zinc-cadmium resistance protein CzcA
MEMVKADLVIAYERFRVLLNKDRDYQPDNASFKLQMPILTDTALDKHPQMRYLRQQQQLSHAQTQLERARLSPDFSLGYVNQSFNGPQLIGGGDHYFDNSSRFSSVQLGVSVPLFFGAQKNRVAASRIQEQRAQAEYQSGLQALQSRYRLAVEEVNKYFALVTYYEKTGLPNAELILKTANLQFTGGQINYLEYTMLINQAIGLRNEYIDAVNNLDQAIIQINSLQNNIP